MSPRRLRLGVIGAGSWTVESHLPAFAGRADVVEPLIVNRRDARQLESIRREFGFARASTDWRDVIAERPDLVVIGSPAVLHHEQARAALDAGAHVLCEKPFTLTGADAWDLADRAQAVGREVVVAFGWNYRPMVIEASGLVGDAAIGDVEHMSIVMASATRSLLSESADGATDGMHANGAPEEGLSKRQAVATPDAAGLGVSPNSETWTDPTRSGGGYAQAQLSHAIGIALWLTGLRGREVFAYLGREPVPGVELHDAIAVRYENGAVGTIAGASNHGADDGKHQLEIRLIGSRGQLLLDLGREALWRYRGPGDDVRVALPPDAGRYDAGGPVEAIVELALGRGVNRSPAELGARTTEILEAVYRSAASHAPAVIDRHAP